MVYIAVFLLEFFKSRGNSESLKLSRLWSAGDGCSQRPVRGFCTTRDLFADRTGFASNTAKMQPSREHLPGLLERNTTVNGGFYSILRRFAGNSSLIKNGC